jgi:Amt family ammonium transporter
MISEAATAWVLMSAVLVYAMAVPGIALLYYGMTWDNRAADRTLAVAAGALVTWTLAVGLGVNVLVGPATLPDWTYQSFQAAFATVAACIAVGSVISRNIPLRTMALMSIGFVTLAYAPIAWATWNEHGPFVEWGVKDFAGGLPVHTLSGAFALTLAIMVNVKSSSLGDVCGHMSEAKQGVYALWIGWLGFNAGSALAADAVASQAIMASMIAVGASLLGAVARNRPDCYNTAILSALVAITPSAGWASPTEAFFIGLLGGYIGVVAEHYLKSLELADDTGTVATHFVVGAFGTLITSGVVGADASLWPQLQAVAVTAAWGALIAIFLWSTLRIFHQTEQVK